MRQQRWEWIEMEMIGGALKKFLESDRQWPRHLRIAHAQYRFHRAMTFTEQDFWADVLEALGAPIP